MSPYISSLSDDHKKEESVKLQVLICTYGHEGIQRVAKALHPRVEGVEYLVSIQENAYDKDFPMPKELDREDFKLFVTLTKGLSINRNIALSQATAPLLLISDDDADYTAEGLKAVIEAFDNNPQADIIAFQYASSSTHKFYPKESVSLQRPPKGYFISSIEIAMRRKSIQGKIWFNENFGIGAIFPSGEEDIFLCDCFAHGLNGIYIPKIIVRHDGTTTTDRNLMLPSRPQTKGAVFLRLHPHDWTLRMLMHTLREFPLWMKGMVPSPFSYLCNWMKGVRMAKKLKVFPTPDLSIYYPCHE
ncbi:MAG: glycosyltransferase [Muribaculaceae bacterium]|nr:glycosyltransferase [Muribaculaceae bacterium]